MNVMLDYIASMLIFGILILTIARVQSNINTTLYLNTQSIVTQGNATSLARQIEWDFLKIGHRVPGQKIIYADSISLRFKSDLENRHIIDDVRYRILATSELPSTFNPRDFPLVRETGSGTIKQNFGLVEFKLHYVDSLYRPIPMPITTVSACARIKGIYVSFRVEASEPTVTAVDTQWAAVSWQKLLFPRNLNSLYY